MCFVSVFVDGKVQRFGSYVAIVTSFDGEEIATCWCHARR